MPIAQLEAALDELWDAFRAQAQNARSVTRASMTTLLIYCENQPGINAVAAEIPRLVEAHPARVVVVAQDSTLNGELEATLCAHYREALEGCQLVAEQITLWFKPTARERIPFLVRSLVIGDLPAALWWACTSPPIVGGELFQALGRMVGQVIYDSMGWPDPIGAVSAMTRWVHDKPQILLDLAWRRLKGWRHLLAQVLDPAIEPDALTAAHELKLSHGPHALTMAWMLTGWLAFRLNWTPRTGRVAASGQSVSWQFDAAGSQSVQVTIERMSEGPVDITGLTLCWKTREGERQVSLTRDQEGRLGVVEQASSVPVSSIIARVPSRAELVAGQLAHRARDLLFDNALYTIGRMARVLNT